MTHARLAGIDLETTDHPGTIAKLCIALGLHAVVLDDAVAELRLDTGTIVQFRQGRTPTRITLTFAVPDLCSAARAIDAQRLGWEATGPNRIRIKRDGGLTVDVTQGNSGLHAVTLSVSDVVANARFWRTLGLTVTDAASAASDADPTDPDEPAVDVRLGGGGADAARVRVAAGHDVAHGDPGRGADRELCRAGPLRVAVPARCCGRRDADAGRVRGTTGAATT